MTFIPVITTPGYDSSVSILECLLILTSDFYISMYTYIFFSVHFGICGRCDIHLSSKTVLITLAFSAL